MLYSFKCFSHFSNHHHRMYYHSEGYSQNTLFFVQVRAKRSVCARFNQELSFREGDVIRVLVSAEDMWSRGMWWPGELRGKKGLFATEHIESFNQDNVSSLYNGTSNNGHSEEWTTSLHSYILSIHFYIPPKKGQPLNNGQNARPQVSIIQRFHC